MDATQMANLTTWMSENNQNFDPANLQAACESYLQVFNTGIHYSFIASVCAMLISLYIFLAFKKIFPAPAKKAAKAEVAEYTAEEKAAMAKEIKQRMAGLYAVLGICVFFWMSFHRTASRFRSSHATLSTLTALPPRCGSSSTPPLLFC